MEAHNLCYYETSMEALAMMYGSSKEKLVITWALSFMKASLYHLPHLKGTFIPGQLAFGKEQLKCTGNKQGKNTLHCWLLFVSWQKLLYVVIHWLHVFLTLFWNCYGFLVVVNNHSVHHGNLLACQVASCGMSCQFLCLSVDILVFQIIAWGIIWTWWAKGWLGASSS